MSIIRYRRQEKMGSEVNLSRRTCEKKGENSEPILTDFLRQGDTKAISRIRIPRGVRWLFLFMRKPPWKGTRRRHHRRSLTNPVAICWDFHKLNSLGRHARGVSGLNDNRVYFFIGDSSTLSTPLGHGLLTAYCNTLIFKVTTYLRFRNSRPLDSRIFD